jgi:hypothetical protein
MRSFAASLSSILEPEAEDRTTVDSAQEKYLNTEAAMNWKPITITKILDPIWTCGRLQVKPQLPVV